MWKTIELCAKFASIQNLMNYQLNKNIYWKMYENDNARIFDQIYAYRKEVLYK